MQDRYLVGPEVAAVRVVKGGVFACLALALASGCTGNITGSPALGETGGTGARAASGSGGSNSPGSGGTSSSATGGSKSDGGTSSSSGGSSSGATGASGGSGGSTAGSAGMPSVGGELSDCTTPGPRLIRRLSSIQYRNTLVDAFGGDASLPSADVLTDPTVLKFRVDADAPVIRDLDAGLLMNYAETVAAWVVQNKLSSLTNGCTTNDANCRQNLIKNLGLKLFREPLTSDRVSAYDTLGGAEATFNDAATQIIGTMLQSPYLLYRRELGQASASDANSYNLSAYEVASELAYFVTDSAPDAALLQAAQDGSLLTQGGLDSQAQRLIHTDAATATISRFVSSWFELDGLTTKAKDDSVFMLTADLRQSMIEETQAFFVNAFKNNGDVASLLTSKTTFVDQGLAAFYGVASGSPNSATCPLTKADCFVVDLSNTQRAPGMLGQAGFLTQHAQPENSSPVQRGRFVRDRLLCEQIPAMPSNLNTNLASGASFTTNRERYEQHDQSSVCAGCHTQFDPVGFSFEHYDGFGRYRDQENNVPIDATGVLYGEPDGDIPLDGVDSLIAYLSTSDQVRACVVRYWSYYAHGRDNWTDKKCNDDSIRREAGQNGYSLSSVYSAILHAPTFAHRVKDQ